VNVWVDPLRADVGRKDEIALVIEGFGCGGAQRVAAHLVNAWIADGCRVHVITMRGPETDFFALPAGIRRHVIGGVGQSANIWTGFVANVRRVRRLRRSLLDTGARTVISFLASTNVLVILATRGLGVHVVVSERNDPTRQDIGRPWQILRRALYRFADVVTANSHSALAAMKSYVPRRKLAVIPNPVVLPAELTNPAASHTILTVGRLVPHKEHALIIEALARLGERASSWRLEILGEGPERAALASLAERCAIGGRVVLSGRLPDPAPHYRAAGIFVIASSYEGTPNVLLEAMAHGLPCVVADCLPGALEHIEDGVTGLVFRSGEADHLALCLSKLMASPNLRSQLGAAGRARVEQFSIERVVADLRAVMTRHGDPSPRG
jgi:glycosyltransferase involved in cell wall biosynthesis